MHILALSQNRVNLASSYAVPSNTITNQWQLICLQLWRHRFTDCCEHNCSCNADAAASMASAQRTEVLRAWHLATDQIKCDQGSSYIKVSSLQTVLHITNSMASSIEPEVQQRPHGSLQMCCVVNGETSVSTLLAGLHSH